MIFIIRSGRVYISSLVFQTTTLKKHSGSKAILNLRKWPLFIYHVFNIFHISCIMFHLSLSFLFSSHFFILRNIILACLIDDYGVFYSDIVCQKQPWGGIFLFFFHHCLVNGLTIFSKINLTNDTESFRKMTSLKILMDKISPYGSYSYTKYGCIVLLYHIFMYSIVVMLYTYILLYCIVVHCRNVLCCSGSSWWQFVK